MLRNIERLTNYFGNSTQNLVIILGATLAGIVLGAVFHFLIYLNSRRRDSQYGTVLLERMGTSMYFVLPFFFILYAMPVIRIPAAEKLILQRTVQILFIISFCWSLAKLTLACNDMLLIKFDVSKPDNVRERSIHTQIGLMKKIIISLIVIGCISLILMRFEGMRKLGQGLITSAGIIGIIMGIAAQRTLANFIAGLQIAFTQPIRLDDVVIVENEWGRIEEITLTYVVVRIWDKRRMVLPITYFVEKPFQNWTRLSSDIIGTAVIYADYSIPVEQVRSELQRIVEKSPLWDHKDCLLQVTNVTERTIQLRAMVSARNSGDAFDLQCEIREKLIAYIQTNYPDTLPRIRVSEFSHS